MDLPSGDQVRKRLPYVRVRNLRVAMAAGRHGRIMESEIVRQEAMRRGVLRSLRCIFLSHMLYFLALPNDKFNNGCSPWFAG